MGFVGILELEVAINEALWSILRWWRVSLVHGYADLALTSGQTGSYCLHAAHLNLLELGAAFLELIGRALR